MKLKRCQLGLAISLAFAGHAQGQALHGQPLSLPPVVVVARPVIDEVKVDSFSSVSAVVTEDQLRDKNAVDITGALRHTPGVQISRYNPVGSFGGDEGGAVFIRGMGASRPSSEIKTYIDGVPVYGTIGNHPLLDMLPMNGMQSITVYKSPQPQISGNNFSFIDLKTRRATEDGVHGDARISGGSFGTLVQQANLLGRDGSIDYSLAQGYARSHGHRPNSNGELSNFMGTIHMKVGDHWSTGASYLYVDTKSSDPGDARAAAPAVAPQFNTEFEMATVHVAHAHGTWTGEFKAYVNNGQGDWLHQPAPNGDWFFKSMLSGLRWKEQFLPWTDGKAVVGIDHDIVDGSGQLNFIPGPSSSFDTTAFKLTSPYAALSHQFTLGEDWALVPSAGLRFYDHSEFGSETAPHAGLSLVSNALTLFANASRGVNYPGLDAPLFSALMPPLGTTWKQLSAEEMEHVEVGAKFSPTQSLQIDISVFQDRIKNRYIFGFPPNVPPPPQFINLGSYKMHGLELALRKSFTENWAIFGGVTLLDPDIDNLPYAPERGVTMGLNGRVGQIRLAVDAQYQSEVWALNRKRMGPPNSEKVGSFTVVNSRVSYAVPQLGKKGEVFVAVENLFDREYSYRPGYEMPGRWGQVGLSASF